MRITILNKRWNLRRAPNMGDRGACEPPDQKNKEIRVLSTLRGQEELEVHIHEMLHAANWHLAEEFVEPCAEDIARVLWRLGYRRVSR